jgi:hypothetical protein
MTYFVVVVVVDSDVLDDAGGEEGVGDAEGAVVVVVESVLVVVLSRDVVPGEAEGAGAGVTRSRSVTRSLRSVQPATRPAPSTRAQTPVRNFCIVIPPRLSRTVCGGCNGGAAERSVEVGSMVADHGRHPVGARGQVRS